MKRPFHLFEVSASSPLSASLRSWYELWFFEIGLRSLHSAHFFCAIPFSLTSFDVCVVGDFFSSTRRSRGSPSCSRKVGAAPDRDKLSLSLGLDDQAKLGSFDFFGLR